MNYQNDKASNDSGFGTGNDIKKMHDFIISGNSFHITSSEKIDVVQKFSNSFLTKISDICFGESGFFNALDSVKDLNSHILLLRNFVKTTLAIPNNLVKEASHIVDYLYESYSYVCHKAPFFHHMTSEQSERYANEFWERQTKLTKMENDYLSSLRDYIYGEDS